MGDRTARRAGTWAPSAALLGWYERQRRDLPWRRLRDPYAIWVSEVMLQQTQVKTVLDYYERWMQRFPTVSALARAREADVLHAWQGLGYYSRAKSLLEAAREIDARHGGAIPRDPSALRALPGIGPYSAGAIASIAFGLPEPVVDGNVARVLTRAFALRGDPARAPLRAGLWELARSLIPEGRASDFNQALMELGATVCLPRAPRCEQCPLADGCEGKRQGIAAELPETAPRRKPTPVRMAGAVVWRKGRVLVVQLAADAPRWAGMWQFPNAELGPREAPEAAAARAVRASTGLDVKVRGLAAVVRHSVTCYRITLELFGCEAAPGTPRPNGVAAATWKTVDELEALALPAAHRKVARGLATPGRRGQLIERVRP
jgi:A/G-specific adenine glycosylase